MLRFQRKKNSRQLFTKTNFGFEFKIKSLQSDQLFLINEEGVLKTL